MFNLYFYCFCVCEKVKSLPLLTVVQEGRRTGLPYLNGWVRIPPPLWRGPITF